MTPTEKRLWSHLRGGRFAKLKFRRQTPIAGYIVDFYCARASLIIELDGESHVGKEATDKKRQQALEAKGFRVLRIWDTHIYDDLDTVLEMIWSECTARGGFPLTPSPLSLKGRGEKEILSVYRAKGGRVVTLRCVTPRRPTDFSPLPLREKGTPPFKLSEFSRRNSLLNASTSGLL
jgi:very-short-patch-repair endonuclease